MKLSFSKYQGSGNDFIFIDDRSSFFPTQNEQAIRFLCSRNFGIGADGLILLQTSTRASFRMRVFNADGREVDFCGNGLRCLALYIKNLGFQEEKILIETEQGLLSCSIQGDTVTTELPIPKILYSGIKVDDIEELFVVHVGVPHAVLLVEELEDYPLHALGPKIRFHPHFAPEGVNVNLVKVEEAGILQIRTYERGVEGETLACGSGAAAAALVVSKMNPALTNIRVKTRSEEVLEFSIEEGRIQMQGNARFVFEGCIEVESLVSFQNQKVLARS